MAINQFQRLTSNTTNVFLGADREQAAINAANRLGFPPDPSPDVVARHPGWPSLQKFDNDTTLQTFSPFGLVDNPDYIWGLPAANGQTIAFAISSGQFLVSQGQFHTFSVFFGAFADNAMKAKIELFEEMVVEGRTRYVKAAPQPFGLDEFLLIAGEPNTPDEGLTETEPYNWQNIRMYSTRFQAPSATPTANRIFRIVVSFEVTNYLIQPNRQNPAGLQFMVDIYQDIDNI